MKITLLPARELSPDLVSTWSQIQRAGSEFGSPFFRPEFTQIVAACRDDVEVAILEQDGEVAGFFPFQRGAGNVGKPVGGKMSDFHGVIARADLQFTADELIRGCRLAAWDFHNLIASQQAFAPFHWELVPSPYMDLSKGFDAFHAERRKAGSRLIMDTLYNVRKLTRRVGPVRFVRDTNDPEVLAVLFKWKSEQYRRTGGINIFNFGWTAGVLRGILEHRAPEFCGILSALYAGDQLVAVDYGMRSGPVLHGWFPAYDREFASYSPGMTLLIKIAESAHSFGIQRHDMCSGPADYKPKLTSATTMMARGTVACGLRARLVRTAWRRTKGWSREGALGAPIRMAGKLTRPLRRWLAFR